MPLQLPDRCTKAGALPPAALLPAPEQRQVDFVISLVALAFDQNRAQLITRQRRGGQSTVAARQIAIYLLRTVFGLTYQQIGTVFLRDRTTISHSCLVVEQMRDDIGLDRRLSRIEDILRCDLFAPVQPVESEPL